jgi:ribosomal protein S18 acetylase RimI-like enzyme
MEIRPLTIADLDALADIDGTIESSRYLHVDGAGEGLAASWRMEERPLREKLIASNPVSDELAFLLKQVGGGVIDDGVALVAEHEGQVVALSLARVDHTASTLRVVDLRVDYDHRREGLASAMMFQLIQQAQDQELRAVAAESLTNNLPAAQFLEKLGFEIAGLDARKYSNHDLVKEAVTLFWYHALD